MSTQLLHLALIIVAWVLVVALFIWLGSLILGMPLLADRRRRLRAIAIALLLFWGAMGAFLWTPAVSYVPQFLWPAFSPFGMTTWPVPKLAQLMSGRVLGIPATPTILLTMVVAMLWAGVLWAPLLAVASRRVALWLAVALEVISIALVAGWAWHQGLA